MNMRNLILCIFLSTALATVARAASAPKFEEVFKVLSTNLGGVSQEDLEGAAVQGLMAQLGPRVSLLGGPASGPTNAPDAAPVACARMFDSGFAYVRVGAVTGSLPDAFRAACRQLAETNKFKGLVLDLRFAGGGDYEAAAKVADCFLNSERPLLDWQTGSARATKTPDASLGPVASLVNSRTTGAAEALAAVLRDADVGLILGGTTAGQASLYKDFPLSTGEQLRVAVAPVSLSGGKVLAKGIVPDIVINASLDEDRAHLDDPYKDLHPPEVAKTDAPTNSITAPHHPFNEAELVREHKAGEDADEDREDAGPAPAAPAVPAIADPVLARALDLLKGLAVVQPNRPG